jgi:hypothetical protein
MVWEEPCYTLGACKVHKKTVSLPVQPCYMNVICMLFSNTRGPTFLHPLLYQIWPANIGMHCSRKISCQDLNSILENAKFIFNTAYISYILTEHNFSVGRIIETPLSSSAKIVLHEQK